MQVETVSCAICGSGKQEPVIPGLLQVHFENIKYRGQLRMVRCGQCGLLYLSPRPSAASLQEVYQQALPSEDTVNANTVLWRDIEKFIASQTLGRGKVLDVGCGSGELLHHLAIKGWDSWGVETSRRRGERARELLGDRVHIGQIETAQLQPASFDVVLLLNVLEHLRHPKDVLLQVREALKPDGLLVLRVPNVEGAFGSLRGYVIEKPKAALIHLSRRLNRTVGLRPYQFTEQHLYYFGRRSLKLLLGATGFRILRVTGQDPLAFQNAGKALRSLRPLRGGIWMLRWGFGIFGNGEELTVMARKTGTSEI